MPPSSQVIQSGTGWQTFTYLVQFDAPNRLDCLMTDCQGRDLRCLCLQRISSQHFSSRRVLHTWSSINAVNGMTEIPMSLVSRSSGKTKQRDFPQPVPTSRIKFSPHRISTAASSCHWKGVIPRTSSESCLSLDMSTVSRVYLRSWGGGGAGCCAWTGLVSAM